MNPEDTIHIDDRATQEFWDDIVRIAMPGLRPGTGCVTLTHVKTHILQCKDTDQKHLVLTLQLITYDVGHTAGDFYIDNIKEQEVFLAPLGQILNIEMDTSRVCRYIEAWSNVITDISNAPTLDDCFITAMPSDFTHFKSHPMDLKGDSVEAYEAALRQQSRLGRYLP
jgi:hypothetical protein